MSKLAQDICALVAAVAISASFHNTYHKSLEQHLTPVIALSAASFSSFQQTQFLNLSCTTRSAASKQN
jgi:hypothetical protein